MRGNNYGGKTVPLLDFRNKEPLIEKEGFQGEKRGIIGLKRGEDPD